MIEGDRTGGTSAAHIGALDGLRALAVAAVLLFHADLGIASGGFLGVSLFFTLSGFLITRLLLHEHARHGRLHLRAFYGRRVRRLLPAAYACIAVVLALGVLWTATQRRNLPGDAVASVLNVANWRFAFAHQTYQDLFIGQPSPLAHFWSLSIEEQCYLVLPLVCVWALRRGIRRLAVTLSLLTVASVAATLLTSDANLVYHGTHTRAAELLLGALAAVATARRLPSPRMATGMSIGGLATLAVLVLLVDLHTGWLYRGGFVLVAVASATAVVGLSADHVVSRRVGAGWLQAVGRRSYGIYLYHWPIFLLLDASGLHADGVALLCMRLAVTLVVAEASYRWLEQPVRRRRVMRGPRAAGLAMGGTALVVLGAALVVVPSPQFTPTEELLARGDDGPLLLATPTADGDARGAGDGRRASGRSAAFAVAEVDDPPTVLVLGTSSAPVLALQVPGWQVVDRTQGECPVAGGAAMLGEGRSERDISRCEPSAARWVRNVLAVDPDVVVLSAGDVDGALVRDTTEAAFPTVDDVAGTAALLVAAEQRTRAAVSLLSQAGVPIVLYDARSVRTGSESTLARIGLQRSLPVVDDAPSLAATVHSLLRPSTDSSTTVTRVLVVGDSTSLDMAQALNDAGAGRVQVQWAGANGCPFVRAEATRAGPGVPWAEGGCPDFATLLPPLLDSFRPDRVLVVLGPTELQQQRYAGDAAAHVAGDAAFTTFHDTEMAEFLRLVGDVPVLVTDAPPVHTGRWATPAMASPERLAAWNAQVRRWADRQGVTVVRYAEALEAYEAQHGDIRPDGVHPEVDRLADLVRGGLLDEITGPPTRP